MRKVSCFVLGLALAASVLLVSPAYSDSSDTVVSAIQNWQTVWRPIYARSGQISRLPEYQDWHRTFQRLQSVTRDDPNYARYAETEAQSWKKNSSVILAAGKREYEFFAKNATNYREAEYRVLELMADDLRHHLEPMSPAGLFDFWSQPQQGRVISGVEIEGFAGPSAYFLRQERYLPFLQRQPLAGCRVIAFPVVRDCTPEEAKQTDQQFQESPDRKVVFTGFILQLDSFGSLVTIGERWTEDPVRVRYLIRLPKSPQSDGEEYPRRERDFLRAGKYKVLFFQGPPSERIDRGSAY